MLRSLRYHFNTKRVGRITTCQNPNCRIKTLHKRDISIYYSFPKNGKYRTLYFHPHCYIENSLPKWNKLLAEPYKYQGGKGKKAKAEMLTLTTEQRKQRLALLARGSRIFVKHAGIIDFNNNCSDYNILYKIKYQLKDLGGIPAKRKWDWEQIHLLPGVEEYK